MKVMMLKTLLSMVMFVNSTIRNLIKLIDHNMETDAVLIEKLLKIKVIIVLYQVKGYCFVKCNNYLTGEEYKEQYLDFIRNEKRRSNIMTKATIQPFCRTNNKNLGQYNEDRVFPRSVTNRDSALYLYNIHFCLIWKSQKFSFNQAIIELKNNFKIDDNYITEENVNSHFKYEFIPKKNESHLSNFNVYDLEAYSTDTARPYNITFYRLSKIAGRYDRDPKKEILKKSIDDTLSFVGDNCIGNALDFLLKFKGDERKVKIKLLNIIYKFMHKMVLVLIHG